MPSKFAELLQLLAEEHERELGALRQHKTIAARQKNNNNNQVLGNESAEETGQRDAADVGLVDDLLEFVHEVRKQLDAPSPPTSPRPAEPISVWRPTASRQGSGSATGQGLYLQQLEQCRAETQHSLARLQALDARLVELLGADPTRVSRGTLASQRSSISRRRTSEASRRKAVVYPTPKKPPLTRLVEDSRFDLFVVCMVTLNASMLGIQINHEATSDTQTSVFEALEVVFSVIFTVELLLRMHVRRLAFCSKGDRQWATLDVALVLISWFDVIMTRLTGGGAGANALFVRLIRMARMARVIRIVRMVRFLTSIRTMAVMIWGSMLSLFWLFVLMAAVTYAFAIMLTTGATAWRKPLEGDPPIDNLNYAKVEDDFGSILATMYTLYKATCGGVSWGEPATTAWETGWEYFLVFLFYTFFTFFSILNIVTGVFVDSAIQHAENDRSVAIHNALQAKEGLANSLTELMQEMDTDDSGFISWDEWRVAMRNKQIEAVMEVIGISLYETEELFTMLDTSGDGFVEISEFLEGMARVKGHARSVDMHRVISQNKRVLSLLEVKPLELKPAR